MLTAHTDGPLAQQKFVTLIAQPDLYGSLLVLFKSVTDGSHLDETPRMRLVDAVDAMADNRGELLFELRGETQRQFALYRVLRGTAEKLICHRRRADWARGRRIKGRDRRPWKYRSGMVEFGFPALSGEIRKNNARPALMARFRETFH